VSDVFLKQRQRHIRNRANDGGGWIGIAWVCTPDVQVGVDDHGMFLWGQNLSGAVFDEVRFDDNAV